MNIDTKKHIDAARQVLVGVVPNPTLQIDQITYALIYKFMDDMDQAAIKNGDEPAFFIGDLEMYSWARLMDTKIGNQDRMNLYVMAFQKFADSRQLPELFRNILRSAFLPYRSPETLGLFLKEIDYFDYSHPEELGNAYEYLLSIMSSQGDAGQFRTPRHIIDFIVDVVNPTKDDKVLDPACGTGGFLVSSYKHILAQHDGKDDPKKKEKTLTPDERKKLMANFEGYDIDPTMVRIAQVNMYLHQFKNPKIFQYDSLSSEERWNDKFDVILANPPFMSPKGGIKPHSKFSIPSSRSEVLFVDYIMNHLRPKGRAGIIVPEGIIFQSGAGHKQLRKNLVEDGLYAVVSLPSGVFAPYSGVKTSILLFNNELAKTSKEILFVKIKSDGFDLGAQRRISTKNDLPMALEVLNKWNTGKKIENKLAVYVEKSKVAENGEYNLSVDRYRIATDYTNAKWPMVELGEVCKVLNGYAFKSNLFNDQKMGMPIIRIRDVNSGFSETYYSGEYDEKYAVNDGDLLIGMDGDFVAVLWKHGKALLNQRVCRLENFNGANKKYIHYLIQKELSAIQETSYAVTVKHLSSSQIEKIKIPLPPLEIQEQIVAELDGYVGIIDGAKQIVKNWKPKIDVDPVWEKVKLEKVCEKLFAGGDVPKDNYSLEKNDKHKIPIYTNGINEKSLYGFTDIARVEKESVTISARGTIGYSEIRKAPFYPAVRLIVAIPDLQKIDLSFLKYSIDALDIYRNGNSIPQLTIPMITNEEILLPPLAIQRQIVEKIEAERALVDSAKKLIDIYDKKTQETIAKLWE